MSEYLDRMPPQSIEAEESILASAMLGSARDITELISSTEFYRSSHQQIFSVIEGLVGCQTEVDLITVTNKLRELDCLGRVGGAEYLASIIDTFPVSTSIKHHAGLIRTAAQKRQLIKICSDTIQKCFSDEPISEMLGWLDRQSCEVDTVSDKFHQFSDLIDPMIERLEKLYTDRLAGKDPLTGIRCGLYDIDRLFGGFQNSNLYVIGARPAMGKSALGMRFLRGAAKLGTPGFFISIEMSKEQTLARELSCASGIDGERFRNGDLNEQHWSKINDAADKICNLPIWIDDSPTAKINDIQAKIRQFTKRHGRCLVVIDYLQYVKGVTSERKDLEIGTITRGLKVSAKEHQIPIILLSQLNRNLESRAPSERRPMVSDLRGSGEIEQDADIIAFLYRDEVYNKNTESKGVAEFDVRKFRDGKLTTIFLAWIDYRATFENYQRPMGAA